MDLPDAIALRPYFFDRGLRFACQKCGRCCVGEPGTIAVSPEESEKIATYLKLPVEEFIDTYLYPFNDGFSIKEDDTGQCLFFDNGCTVYAVRPQQCRSFPFWFSNLRSEQRWNAAAMQCQGIGTGDLHSRHEILSIVRSAMQL